MKLAIVLAGVLCVAFPVRGGAQEDPPATPLDDAEVQADFRRKLEAVDRALPMATGSEKVRLGLERARLLFSLSVEEEDYVEEAMAEVNRLENEDHAPPIPALLTAFHGGIDIVRGKHGFWPPSKVRHVRRGLGKLDDAVRQDPDNPEVRFMRLVGGYFLPFLFGRGDTAEADMAALAQSLPVNRGTFSEDAWLAAIDFLLEHGEFGEAQFDSLTQARENASP